jgi:hypothetical protein
MIMKDKGLPKASIHSSESAKTLADLVDRFQESGRYAFVREEALRELNIHAENLKKAAKRLAAKGRIAVPRRGVTSLSIKPCFVMSHNQQSGPLPSPLGGLGSRLDTPSNAAGVGIMSALRSGPRARRAPTWRTKSITQSHFLKILAQFLLNRVKLRVTRRFENVAVLFFIRFWA